MSLPLTVETLEELPRTPASDVKKHGWRGIMRAISHSKKMLITNHDHPEAVIISIDEYTAMVKAIQDAQPNAALETLRKRFDERLALLNSDDAGDRLRALMDQPARLDKQVKAGTGY